MKIDGCKLGANNESNFKSIMPLQKMSGLASSTPVVSEQLLQQLIKFTMGGGGGPGGGGRKMVEW